MHFSERVERTGAKKERAWEGSEEVAAATPLFFAPREKPLGGRCVWDGCDEPATARCVALRVASATALLISASIAHGTLQTNGTLRRLSESS